MKKILAALLVAGLATLMAVGVANAQMGWTEDWEGYTSGTTPYGDWALANGVWQPLTGGGQAQGAQAYRIPGGQTSRIGKAAGFDASLTEGMTLEGWFYDTNGGTSTKRTWLGVQNWTGSTANVTAALARIGCNNTAQYQFHYYGSALTMINTGLGNETGWHYVKLEFLPAGNGTDWTCNWQINAVDGTPYTGSATWAWAAAAANTVTLGYNYSNGTEVDWDNISVAPNLVPEPGSILALCSGCIGLVGFARRKRA